jgi:hypothetical protein
MSRNSASEPRPPRGAALEQFLGHLARTRGSLAGLHDGAYGRWDIRGERRVRGAARRFEQAAETLHDTLLEAEADALLRGWAPRSGSPSQKTAMGGPSRRRGAL